MDEVELRERVMLFSILFVVIGVVTFFSSIIQGFGLGKSGEELTEKLRKKAFEAMLRQVKLLLYTDVEILESIILYIEYRRDDATKTFFLFTFLRFEYHVSVEHDEKPLNPKFGVNRFMGARNMTA